MSTASYWPRPDLSPAAFVAENAVVIGWVKLGVGVSIWYGAVVRGDVEQIEIGEGTNIQDGAIFTATPVNQQSWKITSRWDIALWCILLTLNGEA